MPIRERWQVRVSYRLPPSADHPVRRQSDPPRDANNLDDARAVARRVFSELSRFVVEVSASLHHQRVLTSDGTGAIVVMRDRLVEVVEPGDESSGPVDVGDALADARRRLLGPVDA